MIQRSRATPASSSGLTTVQSRHASTSQQRLPRAGRSSGRLPRSLRGYGSETRLPLAHKLPIAATGQHLSRGTAQIAPSRRVRAAADGRTSEQARAGFAARVIRPQPRTRQHHGDLRPPNVAFSATNKPGLVHLHSEAHGAAIFEGGQGDASVPTPRTAQRNARRVKQLEDRVRDLEAQLASDEAHPPREDRLISARMEFDDDQAESVDEDDAVATTHESPSRADEAVLPLPAVARGAVVTADSHPSSAGAASELDKLLQDVPRSRFDSGFLPAPLNGAASVADSSTSDSDMDATALESLSVPPPPRQSAPTPTLDVHHMIPDSGSAQIDDYQAADPSEVWQDRDAKAPQRAVLLSSGDSSPVGYRSARGAASARDGKSHTVVKGQGARHSGNNRLHSDSGDADFTDSGPSGSQQRNLSARGAGISGLGAADDILEEIADGMTGHPPSEWLARGLEDEASGAAYVARPSTAEATLLTSDELFLRKVANNMRKLVAGRQPVVLVSTGAFNPVHLQHTRMFYLARAHLNEHTEYQVVGGLISPAHDNEVKNLLRVFPSQAVPIRHRAAMCEIAVSGSSWLAVGRWEATRRRVMPYNSVLQHVQQLLNNAFGGSAKPLVDAVADDMLADLAGHPGVPLGTSPPPTHRDRGGSTTFPSPQHSGASIGSGTSAGMSLSSSPQGKKTPSHLVPRVMYLCGADHLLQAGPQTLRTFGCICCARPGFTDELRSVVGRRYRRLVHVVDDNALLPTSLDSLSSTKVRRRMMAGKEVNSLVGEAVGRYIRATGIDNKVSGRDAWTITDKEGITYNAAVAVRAAALKDHAGALISAHKQHEREQTMKRRGTGIATAGMLSSRRHGQSTSSQASLPRAAAPARGLKVSPVMLPRTDPDSKRSARRGGGRVSGSGAKYLARAGQAVMSSDSLPEFALPSSHGGPALGGGRGRRHWPGGQPRRAGAVPARSVLGGAAASSAAAFGSGQVRGTRAPSAAGRTVTRGQRLAPGANRRAWSGGPRLIG